MKKISIFMLIILCAVPSVKAQVNFIWGKQFGAAEDDKPRNLVTDKSGNIYVFGKTKGQIGEKSYGKEDGFVVKLDSTARLIWKTQIGTTENDDLLKGVTDELGNLYITGYAGIMSENVTSSNILVVKLSKDGKIIWQKQFGTESVDMGIGIAISGKGHIYVIGQTRGTMGEHSYGEEDCVVLHLNNDGSQLNVAQFGTPGMDIGSAISIKNDSEILICGGTTGDLAKTNAGMVDIFWGILTKDLSIKSLMQHGTEERDGVSNIFTDSEDNIYIVGGTVGNMGAVPVGDMDCFIQKLNTKGEVIWSKQFGTSSWDGVHGLARFDDNTILVSGCLNYPACRSFCRLYDKDGSLIWNTNNVIQGEGGGTCGKTICVDSKGNIYHTGYTGASMFSELQGEHDIFVVKFKLDDKIIL